jgi:hypothetical protein
VTVTRICTGRTNREIAGFNISVNTVKKEVQEAINHDLGRFMRKLAEELEVSKWLIRKTVEEDIRYRSYSLL